MLSLTILLLLILGEAVGFSRGFSRFGGRISYSGGRILLSTPEFDGAEFERVLKSAGSMWGTGSKAEQSRTDSVVGAIAMEQEAREQMFRSYTNDAKLPVLPDCNNYYSGRFGDYFWHQNADQVYVFLPIEDDSVTKRDIEVKFSAKSVEVTIADKRVVHFDCLERIIPEGSFWVLETSDKDGKRYIQLDLEKRFRMINWKSLFETPSSTSTPVADEQESRTKMLEKLFAANKGMSKLIKNQNQAIPTESIDEMLQNEDLVRMISDKVYGPRGEGGEDLSDMFEGGEGVVLDGNEKERGSAIDVEGFESEEEEEEAEKP